MSQTPPHNDQWPWPDDLDACIAAPASDHVLCENDAVRVLEVIIEPGTREPLHTHRAPSVMTGQPEFATTPGTRSPMRHPALPSRKREPPG